MQKGRSSTPVVNERPYRQDSGRFLAEQTSEEVTNRVLTARNPLSRLSAALLVAARGLEPVGEGAFLAANLELQSVSADPAARMGALDGDIGDLAVVVAELGDGGGVAAVDVLADHQLAGVVN